MVLLVQRAVESEGGDADRADEHTIEIIPPLVLAQAAMRRLVEGDEHGMHEMAGEQGERDQQPPPFIVETECSRCHVEIEGAENNRKGGLARPRFCNVVGCVVHGVVARDSLGSDAHAATGTPHPPPRGIGG